MLSSFTFHGYETSASGSGAEVQTAASPIPVQPLDYRRGRRDSSAVQDGVGRTTAFELQKQMENYSRVSRKKFIPPPFDNPARECSADTGVTGLTVAREATRMSKPTSCSAEDHFLTSSRQMFKQPPSSFYAEVAATRHPKPKPKPTDFWMGDPGRQEATTNPSRGRMRHHSSTMDNRAVKRRTADKSSSDSQAAVAAAKPTLSNTATNDSKRQLSTAPSSSKPSTDLAWPPPRRNQEVTGKITGDRISLKRLAQVRSSTADASSERRVMLGFADTELHLMSRDAAREAKKIIESDPKKARGRFREQQRIEKKERELIAKEVTRFEVRRQRDKVLREMIAEDLKHHTESVLNNPHKPAPSREWARRGSMSKTSHTNKNHVKTNGGTSLPQRPHTSAGDMPLYRSSRGALMRMRDSGSTYFKIP